MPKSCSENRIQDLKSRNLEIPAWKFNATSYLYVFALFSVWLMACPLICLCQVQECPRLVATIFHRGPVLQIAYPATWSTPGGNASAGDPGWVRPMDGSSWPSAGCLGPFLHLTTCRDGNGMFVVRKSLNYRSWHYATHYPEY